MQTMMEKPVTATEFQTRAGLYIDRAASGPVLITKHRRPCRVLVDFEEYQRLQELARHRPTRAAIAVDDLGEDAIDALRKADYSHIDPELDKLME